MDLRTKGIYARDLPGAHLQPSASAAYRAFSTCSSRISQCGLLPQEAFFSSILEEAKRRGFGEMLRELKELAMVMAGAFSLVGLTDVQIP